MAIQEHPRRLSFGIPPMARRLWAIGLLLYALIAAADMGHHLYQASRAGEVWYAPSNLVVAFSAGLFWPGDVAAHFLLSP